MQPGTQLAHYEILSALGRGGMGEVWKARDTKLGREVAIKTLPAEFAQDADRLARFEREAKLLASLNHPNIGAIYGLEESGGTRFLVLELVEGETLADKLERGAVPVAEALGLALQIAEALETAHEKGVVHRDLKPANIKLTSEGRVKVLDFGLAKALAGDGSELNLSNSPTLSLAATRQGIILGTAAYMAPEQAKGRPVDRRADVWAFGCVLYEMLAGRQAFRGDEVSEILASVLAREPDYRLLAADLDARVERLLRRCFEKDPRNRWQAVGDLRVEIRQILDDSSGVRRHPAVSVPDRGTFRWIPVAAAAAITALVTGFAVWTFKPAPPGEPGSFVLSGTPSAPLIDLTARDGLAIAPDGRTVAYRVGTEGARDLYVRRLEGLEGSLLGAIPDGDLGAVFFSPDGDWIGFMTNSDASLRRIPVLGGPSVRITDMQAEPRGGTWGPDDTIIFGDVNPGEGLIRVRVQDGERTVLTTPEEGRDHFWPEFLPGGKAVLFTIATDTDPSEWQIAVLDLETGERKILIPGGSRPRYASTGHIVYGAEGALRAVRFDPESLEVTGNSVPLVEDVASASSGRFEYDLAENGTLVYVSGGTLTSDRRRLVWVDREGNEIEEIAAERDAYVYPRISPDRSRVALDARDEDNNIWIWDFARQTRTRLLLGEAGGRGPVWTPDSARIAYAARRGILWTAANNTGTPQLLLDSSLSGSQEVGPSFFTSDETGTVNGLVYTALGRPGTGDDIGMLGLEEEDTRETDWLLEGESDELTAELSPDGRWMAYELSESGRRPEIFVRPFPDVSDDSIQVSNSGGIDPLWSRDGTELFYLGISGSPPTPRLISVPVHRDATELGSLLGPRNVLIEDWPYFAGLLGRNYDVSEDGRFLAIDATEEDADTDAPPPQLRIVLEWDETLNALVP